MNLDKFLEELDAQDIQYIKRNKDNSSYKDIIDGLKEVETNFSNQYSKYNPEYKNYLNSLCNSKYESRLKLINNIESDILIDMIKQDKFYIEDTFSSYLLKNNLKDEKLFIYTNLLNDYKRPNETINLIDTKEVIDNLGKELNHMNDSIRDINLRYERIKELYDMLINSNK